MKTTVPPELVVAAVAGETAATEELLRLVWPDAYRIAWSVLGERTASEDAAQEACARVVSAIAGLRTPAYFNTWLYRIVVNEANQHRRAAARESRTQDVPQAVVTTAAEELIDVRQAVAALDPPLRLAVVLYYYYALDCAEIARIASVSAVTIRWRLHVARRRLREALSDRPPQNVYAFAEGEHSDEYQAAR